MEITILQTHKNSKKSGTTMSRYLLKKKDYIASSFLRSTHLTEFRELILQIGLKRVHGIAGTALDLTDPPGYEIEHIFDKDGYKNRKVEELIFTNAGFKAALIQQLYWELVPDEDFETVIS